MELIDNCIGNFKLKTTKIFFKSSFKSILAQKSCISVMFCFDVLSIWRHTQPSKHSRPSLFMLTEKLEIGNFERRKVDKDQIFDL